MGESEGRLRPILLVDDNESDAVMTQLVLSRVGLPNPIVLKQDGEQALDYLLRRGEHAQRDAIDPLFVLLDIKMPRVDGLELLARLRQHATLQHLPVIMLTSSGLPGDVQQAYDRGASAYVVKAVDFKEFERSIRALGEFWGRYNLPPVTHRPVGPVF